MPTMGKYCKAYPINRLKEFAGFKISDQNMRKEKRTVEGAEVEVARELGENDFFYLQENFVVTDGIFLDANIVFDSVTPEWREFCKNELKFEIPVYETVSQQTEA